MLSSPISVGHKGQYGHEFLEFEFRKDGRLRYANNSNYKSDKLIRKEGKSNRICHTSLSPTSVLAVFVNDNVVGGLKKIIEDSDILR